MPAHLVLQTDESVVFPLDKPILILGRSEDCDVIIKKTMKLSRVHCCIAQVNSEHVIRDLGSMNGIKVNGKRVLENRLAEGDQISLGDLKFRYTLSPKIVSPKQKPTTKASPPPLPAAKKAPIPPIPKGKRPPLQPLDLSLDFPQIIHDDNDSREVDQETPLHPRPQRPKKKKPSQGSGGLDSGDLDVGGLKKS